MSNKAKKASFLRLLGTTGCLSFFVYLWCLMYIPLGFVMIPRFKYFSEEPEPIPLSQTVGDPKTLSVDYTYEAMDEEGNKREITVRRGTVVYPLFRASESSWSIYVADQRGNIFLLNDVSKDLDVRNERVNLRLRKERKETEPSINLLSEKNLNDIARNIFAYDNKVKQSDIEGKDIRISHTKIAGAQKQTYMGLTADGKFLGYSLGGY